MEALILARVLHVIAIVLWIGGVGIVTLIVLPAARASPEGVRMFELVERKFSWLVRGMIILAGLSGLYMTWSLDLWPRFSDPAYWWMWAMVVVWTVFTGILFVGEPLLYRKLADRIRQQPQAHFTRILLLHWILLIAALLTIAGAVAGAHGYVFR